MEFRILGPLEAVNHGRLLDLGGTKQRSLLAVLLLNANHVVPSEQLIEAIWGHDPPPTAPSMLRNYVSRLRRELNGSSGIETRPPGYVLRVELGSIDADVFQRLYDAGQRARREGRFREATQAFQNALDLWRGPALADLAGTEVGEEERARFEDLRLAAVAARIDADLALGRDGDLIAEVEGLVRQHPHNETFRRQLMLALYRAGRQSDALAAYRDARRRLVTDLGLEPGRDLRDLEAAILRHDPALEPDRVSSGERSRRRLARPTRKAVAFAGAATAAIALGTVLAITLGAASGGSAVQVRANSVAALDDSGRVVADIPLGAPPTALVAGPDGVWVATQNQTARRIDPVSRRITRTIGLGLVPTDLAISRQALWVASQGYLHRVLRVALNDGDIRSIPLPVSMSHAGRAGHVATLGDVALAADGDHSLFRVRELAAKRIADVPNGFGGPAGHVAVGSGGIWVSDPHEGLVSRVDPRSGTVLASVSLAPLSETSAAPLAVSHGTVWVALGARRTLFEIDQQTTTVARTFVVGPGPSGVAVGEDAIWASDATGAPVIRIDLISGRTKRIPVGLPTTGVAAAHQLVWVAVSN
jgi:DNA-binding SARP family transcriptional activator/streptogramin lyase